MELENFYHRANIRVFHYKKIPVLVYEDHRYLLNVLHCLKYPPYNLIYFDYHDDALSPTEGQLNLIKELRAKSPDQPEMWNFVEFKLRGLDDDWLLAGMELGLIKDAVLIGGKDTNNLSTIQDGYTDHMGDTHYVHQINHLWYSLGVRGALGDSVTKDLSYSEARRIIGYNTENNYNRFAPEMPEPYVLDFDCDVFSTEVLEQTQAWPRDRMFEFFQERIDQAYMNSTEFVKMMMDRAEVITICRESGCCGGFMESAKILNNMNDLFFDGIIK